VPWIGDKLLSNIYTDIGSLTFGTNGYVSGDGKFGKRFEELRQEAVIDTPAADAEAAAGPTPKTPTGTTSTTTPPSAATTGGTKVASVGDAKPTGSVRVASEGLRASLLSVSREPVYVLGDGNCFYSAVVMSATLGGSAKYTSQEALRNAVADLVLRVNNRPPLALTPIVDVLRSALPSGRTFEQLAAEIRTGGTWADQICIPIAAVSMGRSIHVHQEGQSSLPHLERLGAPIHIGFERANEHYWASQPVPPSS
jgi:hypothetical protein